MEASSLLLLRNQFIPSTELLPAQHSQTGFSPSQQLEVGCWKLHYGAELGSMCFLPFTADTVAHPG